MKSQSLKDLWKDYKEFIYPKIYLLLLVGVLVSISPILFNQFYFKEKIVLGMVYDIVSNSPVPNSSVAIDVDNELLVLLHTDSLGFFLGKVKVKAPVNRLMVRVYAEEFFAHKDQMEVHSKKIPSFWPIFWLQSDTIDLGKIYLSRIQDFKSKIIN